MTVRQRSLLREFGQTLDRLRVIEGTLARAEGEANQSASAVGQDVRALRAARGQVDTVLDGLLLELHLAL